MRWSRRRFPASSHVYTLHFLKKMINSYNFVHGDFVNMVLYVVNLKRPRSISCTNLASMSEGYMKGDRRVKNTNSVKFMIRVTDFNLCRFSYRIDEEEDESDRKTEQSRRRWRLKLEMQKRRGKEKQNMYHEIALMTRN